MPTRRFCLKFVPAATFAWLFGTREPKQLQASESLQIKLDADAAKMAADLKQKIDKEIEQLIGNARPKARRLPEVEWKAQHSMYPNGRVEKNTAYWTRLGSQHIEVRIIKTTPFNDPCLPDSEWTWRVGEWQSCRSGKAKTLSEAKFLAVDKAVELIESDYRKLQEMLK